MMWKAWQNLVISTCLYGCLISQAFAIQAMTLSLGNIDQKTWRAEDIVLKLQLHAPMILSLEIAALHLPNLPQPLRKLRAHCSQLEYRPELINCTKAQLSLPTLGNGEIEFQYAPKTQKLQLKLNSLAVAAGHLSGTLHMQGEQWQAEFNATQINLTTLLKAFDIPPALSLKLGGIAQLNVKLNAQPQKMQVQLEGQGSRVSFGNEEGTQAGEQLNAAFSFKARQADNIWQFNSELRILAGELLSQPLYLKVIRKQPVIVHVVGTYQKNYLEIQNFEYTHAEILNFGMQGKFNLTKQFEIEALHLELPYTALQPLYTHYIQEGMEKDAVFSALQLKGSWELYIDIGKQRGMVRNRLHDVDIEDVQKRFALKGLAGEIVWNQDKTDISSQLKWNEGFVAQQITFGASHIKALLQGRSIRLLNPIHLPILDGALHIEKCHFQHLGLETLQGNFTANLQPISLPALSSALGLPKLNGQLSGSIPALQYRANDIELGGAVTLNIFDGEIIFQTLHLDHSKQRRPVLSADVIVNKLDLGTITQITEFGEIQGKLSGKIHDLKMVNWQPVAFDALLVTPENDETPHKISQKAVNNLTSIGGSGAINALSRGVLGLFENFTYQRLGIGCRLVNGVCEMHGIEDTPKGYYIVKGGGLPRIDVIGYNQRVNWDVLLNRLKSVTKLEKPIIK